MSTSTIFDDNFTEYSPGDTTITGFFNPNGWEVVDFSTMTGTTPAPGFFENTGKGLLANGGIFHQELVEQSATQVTWEGWSGNGINTPVIYLDSVNLSEGTTSAPSAQTNMCSIQINTDLTMSFVCTSTSSGGLYQGAAIIATTEQQVVFPYTWQYFQANFTFSSTVVGGVTVLVVSCVLGVDGAVVLTGTGTTAINVASLWTEFPPLNQWRFVAGNSYFSNITGIVASGTSTLPPVGTWPHTGTPLVGYLTQGVVEVPAIPTVRAGRMTQGVVEVPARPATRAARMTQGVVEIVFIPTFVPTSWFVYEA